MFFFSDIHVHNSYSCCDYAHVCNSPSSARRVNKQTPADSSLNQSLTVGLIFPYFSNFLPIHPSSYKQHFLSPHLSSLPFPSLPGLETLPGPDRWTSAGVKQKAGKGAFPSFSHLQPLGTQIKKQHQKGAEMKAAKKVERCQTSEPRFAYSDFPIDRLRHWIIGRPSHR